MRAKHGTYPVIVSEVEDVTPLIRRFRLTDPTGERLPGFSGGSHVILLIEKGDVTFRNPYSIMSTPFDTRYYDIAISRQDGGRGGSRRMHKAVKEGTRLEISYPANQFPLDTLARKHILVAGGVGLTPMLSQLKELELGKAPFELHYAVRSRDHLGLHKFLSQTTQAAAHLYPEDETGRIDFAAVLSDQPLGSHLYVCGPRGMLDAALRVAREKGWPESHIHFELFNQQTSGEPFTATFVRSGKTVAVPPELSLLEAAESAGISIPFLCRGGACGYCETEVLQVDGEIIHGDIWLSEEDKHLNRKIMPCVSRARCTRLVLDA